jgi:hypothetical protein
MLYQVVFWNGDYIEQNASGLCFVGKIAHDFMPVIHKYNLTLDQFASEESIKPLVSNFVYNVEK